ncbi:MAG: glycosyltransferase family 4 protein [Actinomycetota bacterium]|nr:glycosyltransferase family 4 protein [Actinomycetota bacterium]
MKRLLVFTENYVRGGGNRYLIDSVNAVNGLFNEVVIAGNPGSLFSEDRARLRAGFSWLPVDVITKGRLMEGAKAWPRFLKLIPWLAALVLAPVLSLYNLIICLRLIGKTEPSTVLGCNGGYPGGQSVLAMLVAARCLKVPAVLSVVSVPMQRSTIGLYGRITDSLVSWAASAIIVNAKAVADGMRSLRGFPAEKIIVVHNGLEDKVSSRREVSDELRVGCVSRLDKEKGVLYLLEAFSLLAPVHSTLRLVMVGQGDASDVLARRVNELALNERVDLVGYYDGDISVVLAEIDIYVFPSLHEGFPYSILEAMRAGCAIVATSVGGIPEAISNEREGLLVEPASAQALADAIARLIADKALRARLGAAARARFIKEFSLKAMGGRLVDVFLTAIGDEDLAGRVKHDAELSS